MQDTDTQSPLPQGPLSGKTALITGASGGIGFVAARALAQTGCGLHMVGHNFSKIYNAVIEIRNNYSVPVEQHSSDAANTINAEAICMAAGDADIFVSCTGNLPKGSLEDIGDASWRKRWEQAVYAPINMVREMSGHMSDEKRGLIILLIDAPSDAQADDICASAAGAVLKTIVEGVAQKLPQGVRILGLSTERDVDANALSEAITRLAIDPSGFATGSIITASDVLSQDAEDQDSAHDDDAHDAGDSEEETS